MAFAENLNYCMQERGYSAYRLAIILDVNNQSVLNWQHGDRIPHKKTRIKIAEHFGLTLEELDGDELPTLPAVEPDQGIKKDLPKEVDKLSDLQKQVWDIVLNMSEDSLQAIVQLWGNKQ